MFAFLILTFGKCSKIANECFNCLQTEDGECLETESGECILF